LIDGHFFIDGNQSALDILNMSSKEELRVVHPGQISPKYQPCGERSVIKAESMIKLCLKEGFNRFEWMHKTLDDNEFLVEVTLKTIQINNKKMIHVTWRDIEAQKKYESKLATSNKELIKKNSYINEILSTLQDKNHSIDILLETLTILEQYKQIIDESAIVSKTDVYGVITYTNDKFCEISGYTKEELIGQSHNIIRHPDSADEFFRDLWKTISNKKIFKGMVKNKRKNGEAYYVDSTIIPILDKDENIAEYIGIRHDLTPLLKKDKIILEQFTDKLTSLPNRQKLIMDIQKQISPTLALINIDRFKDINSSYGIDFGDNILKSFAKELMGFKSRNLNVYRVYGDIFAISAFGNFSYKEFIKTTKMIIKHFDNYIFNIKEINLNMTCTIGISSNEEKPLTSAEMALLYARQNQKSFMIFNKDMTIYKKFKQNIQLTKDIKYAIDNNKILLYGQKLLNNKTNEIKYETLMRMQLEDGSIISPFKFLKHAKKARLYSSLTKIIIEKACDYFQNKECEFSINLMLQDILDATTIDFLINKLTQTKTSNRVILEIVESEGIENFKEISHFIQRVQDLGCKVAIDDFGTGYSNFEYIIELNVEILKIDGSLIKNIHTNDNTKLTVQTIVNFAKVLKMDVVAEFVHCKEVQEIVESLGITYSQGFLFHQPELLEEEVPE